MTLIELLITVAVIVIVFAIAVPVVLNVTAGVHTDADTVSASARADWQAQYIDALGATKVTANGYDYAVFNGRTVSRIAAAGGGQQQGGGNSVISAQLTNDQVPFPHTLTPSVMTLNTVTGTLTVRVPVGQWAPFGDLVDFTAVTPHFVNLQQKNPAADVGRLDILGADETFDGSDVIVTVNIANAVFVGTTDSMGLTAANIADYVLTVNAANLPVSDRFTF